MLDSKPMWPELSSSQDDDEKARPGSGGKHLPESPSRQPDKVQELDVKQIYEASTGAVVKKEAPVHEMPG